MELNHGMEVPQETYCPNELLKKILKSIVDGKMNVGG
jgi:hypothetical protein